MTTANRPEETHAVSAPIVAAFHADSRCECQASLRAELDGNRNVLRGTAFLRGKRELAPSHAIGANAGERFDIGWACPFCGRNVMRSFDATALPRVR
jgi:hypothetical protein